MPLVAQYQMDSRRDLFELNSNRARKERAQEQGGGPLIAFP